MSWLLRWWRGEASRTRHFPVEGEALLPGPLPDRSNEVRGIPVVADDHVPSNVVELRDGGRKVAEIINLDEEREKRPPRVTWLT